VPIDRTSQPIPVTIHVTNMTNGHP
jgi:hypothetical protein